MIIRMLEYTEALDDDGLRFREHAAPRYFRRSLHLVTLFAIRREQWTGSI